MPYTMDTVPPEVARRLPPSEQEIWVSAFNDTYAQTHDDKKAFIAAWGAVNKKKLLARIKSTKDGKVIVEGWGMLFTDSKNQDLEDEHFSALTQLLLEFYKDAPLWYEHGMDKDYGVKPIGKRHQCQVFPRGIWVAHELFQDHPYFERTINEIENFELVLSSDSMSQYWMQDNQGYNYSWPVAGWSLTKSPAEPALGYVALKTFSDTLTALTGQNAQEARRAREVQKPDDARLLPMKNQKDVTMNEEMLSQLAAFLGMDSADPETLAARLREMAAQLEGAAMEMEGEDYEDLTGKAEDEMSEEEKSKAEEQEEMVKLSNSLKSALGLEKSASLVDVADELRAIAKAAKSKTGKGELDPKALESFGQAWKSGKGKSAQAPLPKQSRFNEDAGEREERRPVKSRAYGAVNFRIGEPKQKSFGATLQEIYSDVMANRKPTKSASYQIGSNAGFLLNHEISNDFIEVLRDKLILANLGADMLTMDGQETLTLPKDKTEHTAYWVGEGTEIPESDETIGGVTLYPKPLAAYIVVPNKFLANSRVNYESRVQEKATFAINRAIELAALFGTGGKTGDNTGVQPVGLSTLGDMTSRSVTKTYLGANSAQATLANIEDMIGRVEDANVEDDGTWGFALSPKGKRFFGNMKDADGNYILRGRASENIEANFLGYGYQESNLISNTVTRGTSTDNTTTFFGKWSDLKIGMSNQVEIFIDPYSQSRKLQTVIIAHIYADVAVAHDESFEILVHRV